jgi:hypothetical protein
VGPEINKGLNLKSSSLIMCGRTSGITPAKST